MHSFCFSNVELDDTAIAFRPSGLTHPGAGNITSDDSEAPLSNRSNRHLTDVLGYRSLPNSFYRRAPRFAMRSLNWRVKSSSDASSE
jgi:hypothetical protein